MKEMNEKISIFKFQLDKDWSGTLFFIALIGVLYTSGFVWYIGSIISYIRMIILGAVPSYIQIQYIGYIISSSFSLIFSIISFAICLYILIRCISSRSINSNLEKNPRLFKFHLSQNHLLGVFIISLLVLLSMIPLLISRINNMWLFIYYLQQGSGPISIESLFEVAFSGFVYQHLVTTGVAMCILSIIALKVSAGSIKSRI